MCRPGRRDGAAGKDRGSPHPFAPARGLLSGGRMSASLTDRLRAVVNPPRPIGLEKEFVEPYANPAASRDDPRPLDERAALLETVLGGQWQTAGGAHTFVV